MLSLLAGLALAQAPPEAPSLNAQLFTPSIDATHTLWADDTALAPDGTVQARGLLHYADDPIVYVAGSGRRTALVGDLLQLDLMGAYTKGPVRLGAYVPVYLRSVSPEGGASGLGDLALEVRGTLFDRVEDAAGLAVLGRFVAPTSTLGGALGHAGVGVEGAVIADKQLGDSVVTVNAGYRVVPAVELENVAWDDQLVARLGFGHALSPRAGLSADLAGHFNLGDLAKVGWPVEGLIGGWGVVGDGLRLRGGVGTGITPGIGSPRLRLVLGASFRPQVRPDPDGDGLIGEADACPAEAEDVDGHEDADGCPDPTLVTVQVVDSAGQPVSDAKWNVIDHGAGRSGQALELPGGTYAAEAWSTGRDQVTVDLVVPDAPTHTATVELPAAPGRLMALVSGPDGELLEDATVAILDLEGGPWPPAEEIPVPPGRWRIRVAHPDWAPVIRGVTIESERLASLVFNLDANKVQVTENAIELEEQVFFETDSAVIRDASYGLLDQVASTLLTHPELEKVRIEGHTDSRGRAEYNLELSQARAASVRRYLVDRGVDPARLEAVGYGETRPLDDRETPAAWAQNRRVDLTVIERSDD